MKRFIFLATTLTLSSAACSNDDDTNNTGDTGSSDVAVDAADAGEVGDVSDTSVDTNPEDVGVDVAPPRCIDGLAPGTVEVFFDGFVGGSEGIAFGTDGLLYVTGESALWRLDAAGTRTKVADIPFPLGIAPVADGLLVAGKGESNAPSVMDGALFHVTLDGVVTTVADGLPSPNFVTVLADGSALVSDDFDTRVWRVFRDGTVVEVLDAIESPNGMSFSPDGSTLYIASTFTDRGQITAFDVDADGVPVASSAVEVAECGEASTPDGTAVDTLGRVYVAANLQRRIVRFLPGSEDAIEDVATGLNTPASMAFGAGDGFDPCSMYVTSLFGPQVLRVVVGVEGTPVLPGTPPATP